MATIKIKIATVEDYVKANRKGSREAELELNNNGWTTKHKVHRSKKQYTRKSKHKNKLV